MKRASSLRSKEVPTPWSLSSRSFNSDMSPMECLRWCCGTSGRGRGGELARRRLDRFDDVLVAGATTEVAGEAAADLLLGRVRVLLEQAVGARQHPRRAIAALKPVLLV